MRYRPLGSTGTAVSAITLVLDASVASKGAEAVRALVLHALELGINSFHIDSLDRTLLKTAGEAFSHLERELLHVSLTVGPLPNGRRDFTLEGIDAVLAAVLKTSELQYFDAIILDDPDKSELPSNVMKSIRNDSRTKKLGVRGASEVMDIYIGSSLFAVLHTPCHLRLNAVERGRMREARSQDMAIFGTDYFNEAMFDMPAPPPAPVKRGLFGIKKKPEPVAMPVSPFEFLRTTSGWEAEYLCLAHALLDPSIGSVLVKSTTLERLDQLAETCERDMPVSLPAQLEMARVAASRAA